jgi:hypothetical protein
MAMKQISIESLQPAGRQRACNAVIGLDGRGRTALMPARRMGAGKTEAGWGEYVDTYSAKTYQMDIYQYHAVMKSGGEARELERRDTARDENEIPFRKALYEKTLRGNVFIILYANSTISCVDGKGKETPVNFEGIEGEILDIIYAFNRLVITTADSVHWSKPGLNEGEKIEGALSKKQSDFVTSRYLGCYSDMKSLYLFTAGGYEAWKPTQDMDSPFIYSASMQGRIEAFCSQWCLMETDEHRLGIFSVAEEKFLTGDRWIMNPGEARSMKSFWLPQTGGKQLAIYLESGMWLMDCRHGLATWMDEAFNPSQEPGDGFMDMRIILELEKGTYASLFMQLGKFPEEIKFFMDSFCMRRAPLVAFCRDDVIKTANIGKLAADTPLELNFKGDFSIYSLGLEQPGG